MDDLAAWLCAQFDEDEQAAQKAGRHGARWPTGDNDRLTPETAHARRWDPARVFAEVDAKRRILDLHDGGNDGGYPSGYYAAKDDVLRLLALPYADRPGYQEKWRP